MQKIKVLEIIARLNIGGSASHAILLTEGLDRNRFDILLICGSVGQDEGDMFYYAIEKNVNPYFVPELKRKLSFFNDIIAFKKIYNIIKTEHPDIIHTHTAKAGALGRMAGILYNLFSLTHKRVKLIHTFHGHVFSGYFSKFKVKLFILIERFLALFTCRIITVSESVKRDLVSLRICNEGKIKIIPLGFELEKFLNIPVRDDIILNIGIVGRLTPIKNHRLFLEAVAKAIGDNPRMKLRFKIIGDGQLRKELEEYSIKLNILSFIEFLGWQNDLAGVYSDLDIVTLTSINEGTPVSLIEAMASARAIVATDAGGVKDLLGNEIDVYAKPDADFKVLERGIIVKPQDSNSFAIALTFMLQHSDLRKDMCVRGREFIRTGFSKNRLIKDIENLYDELLEMQ